MPFNCTTGFTEFYGFKQVSARALNVFIALVSLSWDSHSPLLTLSSEPPLNTDIELPPPLFIWPHLLHSCYTVVSSPVNSLNSISFCLTGFLRWILGLVHLLAVPRAYNGPRYQPLMLTAMCSGASLVRTLAARRSPLDPGFATRSVSIGTPTERET